MGGVMLTLESKNPSISLSALYLCSCKHKYLMELLKKGGKVGGKTSFLPLIPKLERVAEL